MKRRKFLSHLKKHGCQQIREGGKLSPSAVNLHLKLTQYWSEPLEVEPCQLRPSIDPIRSKLLFKFHGGYIVVALNESGAGCCKT